MKPSTLRAIGLPVAVIACLFTMLAVSGYLSECLDGSFISQTFILVSSGFSGMYAGKFTGFLFFKRWDWFRTCDADYKD